MQHNKNHFICKLFPNDEIREKIFNGTLDENDCDNEDARTFLNLLQDKGTNRRTKHNPLTEGEWVNAVMKSNKSSTSSAFSDHNYAVCKCALGSERLTKVLVAYCNLLISNQCYPIRWIKALNAMSEKGNGPVLGKLRTMQLIEADFKMLMRIFENERMAGKI